jgi:hypothetical protein
MEPEASRKSEAARIHGGAGSSGKERKEPGCLPTPLRPHFDALCKKKGKTEQWLSHNS